MAASFGSAWGAQTPDVTVDYAYFPSASSPSFGNDVAPGYAQKPGIYRGYPQVTETNATGVVRYHEFVINPGSYVGELDGREKVVEVRQPSGGGYVLWQRTTTNWTSTRTW